MPAGVDPEIELAVDPAVQTVKGIHPAAAASAIPHPHSALHIIQHTHGKAMQVDFNTNGVTGVDTTRGLIRIDPVTA